MSRTYRRKTARYQLQEQTDRIHSWAAWATARGATSDVDKVREEIQTARDRFHLDGNWTMTTPAWWIRMAMTRPQRQRTRALCDLTLRLCDLDDTPLFPLAKRPHVYYW